MDKFIEQLLTLVPQTGMRLGGEGERLRPFIVTTLVSGLLTLLLGTLQDRSVCITGPPVQIRVNRSIQTAT